MQAVAVTEQTLYDCMRAAPCRYVGDYASVDFPAMGTQNRLLFRASTRTRAEAFMAAAWRWLAAFEFRFSTYIADSMISRLNDAAGGWSPIDPAWDELFALTDWYHWKTMQVLDPSMGPLIELWDYHKPDARPPDEGAIAAARGLVGWTLLERRSGQARLPRPGMRLDFGGIGKEYAVDRVAALAGEHGIRDLLVDLGHDLRVDGEPPEGGAWRLGLEHPTQPGRCWAGFALACGALCASGDYLRGFDHAGRRYGHILDPRTGCPAATDCRAVWVTAASATEAGALATAALVLGTDAGLQIIGQTHGAEGCVWSHDRTHQTKEFARHVTAEAAA